MMYFKVWPEIGQLARGILVECLLAKNADAGSVGVSILLGKFWYRLDILIVHDWWHSISGANFEGFDFSRCW